MMCYYLNLQFQGQRVNLLRPFIDIGPKPSKVKFQSK